MVAALSQLETPQQLVFEPQPGPQYEFSSNAADIVIYGGAAGGGKSYALLLEILRWIHLPGFRAIFFRRSLPQITQLGGLWDKSREIYPHFKGVPNENEHLYKFPAGAIAKFAGMLREDDCMQHDGAQYALICFDELIHFTEKQFWYMVSRNRSTCGVRSYIRATTNPRKTSWVKKFIRWWLDADGKYPDPAKSGRIRWLLRRNNVIHWADSPDELLQKFPDAKAEHCKSVAFIPAKLSDNPALTNSDPGYQANINAMTEAERERLGSGNWDTDDEPGDYFREEFFPPVPMPQPNEFEQVVRYWDRAATKPSENNPDPDWTRGLLMGKRKSDGKPVILHVAGLRDTPGQVAKTIKDFARIDQARYKFAYTVVLEQDPGQAGVSEVQSLINSLAGFACESVKVSKDKATRARPVSTYAENVGIEMVEGEWNQEFLSEAENFPNGGHDDQVDTLSGAFNFLYPPEENYDSYAGYGD